MSIASEITRLQNAKSDIKASIENKGVTVGDGTIDTYASKINEISTSSAVLGTKTITENGTYKAIDDELDGYSEVEVACSKYAPRIISFSGYKGAELNYEIANLDTSNVTDMNSMFYDCNKLTTLDLSNFNTSSVSSMNNMFNSCVILVNLNLSNFITNNLTSSQYMFAYCSALKSLNLSNFNTSKVINMSNMFYGCTKLEYLDLSNFDTSKVVNFSNIFYNCIKLTTIPKLNASSSININNFAYSCKSLTDFGGLENLGQAYSTTSSANYGNYKLDLSTCTALTHDSLMNVINNLYDIATKGCNTQQLVLGSTNIAKLTAEEIAIATNKGWTVS